METQRDLEVGFVERACRAGQCAVVRCATPAGLWGGLMEVRLTFLVEKYFYDIIDYAYTAAYTKTS
jgi:hypothetical protein